MGAIASSVISQVREVKDAADAKVIDMTKESLRQLLSSAELIAEGFKLQVTNELKGQDAVSKWRVSGGRQDREHVVINVVTKSSPASKLDDTLNSICGTLFGIVDGKASDAAKSFLTGLSQLVKGALNVFLGNAAAGAHQTSTFMIIPHGVTFYRVDVKGYRYNLESEGFTKHYEGIFVVYVSRAILEIQDIKLEELLSYINDISGGDKTAIIKWIQDYKQLTIAGRELMRLNTDSIENKVTKTLHHKNLEKLNTSRISSHSQNGNDGDDEHGNDEGFGSLTELAFPNTPQSKLLAGFTGLKKAE